MDLRAHIRDIPDFPKPGIVFKDITPLLANGPALRAMVDHLRERYTGSVDMVLGRSSSVRSVRVSTGQKHCVPGEQPRRGGKAPL